MSTLRMIHFALMIVVFALSAAVLVLTQQEVIEPSMPAAGVIRYIPAIVLISAIPVSAMVFRTAIRGLIGTSMPVDQKVQAYTTAHIVRMAFFEGAAMFAVIIIFLTGDLMQLVVVGAALAMFVTRIPTPFRLENELQLTQEEKEELGGN